RAQWLRAHNPGNHHPVDGDSACLEQSARLPGALIAQVKVVLARSGEIRVSREKYKGAQVRADRTGDERLDVAGELVDPRLLIGKDLNGLAELQREARDAFRQRLEPRLLFNNVARAEGDVARHGKGANTRRFNPAGG